MVRDAKEGNAYVVEVETNSRIEPSKPTVTTMEIVHNEDATLAHKGKDFVARMLGVAQINGLIVTSFPSPHLSRLTSTTQIAFSMLVGIGHDNETRLAIVGNAQHQLQTLSHTKTQMERQRRHQFFVGIEQFTLVDDLGDKPKGKGRMHSITATMTETEKPNERIVDEHHIKQS